MFALSTQGFYDLEGNMGMLGHWMSDALSLIGFYHDDNAAANAANK